MSAPFQFEPFLLSKVWGGRRLGQYLGKTLVDDQPYGESWEVSDHASHVSVVRNGPWQGLTLDDLMRDHRKELLGTATGTATFPLLLKFLDANDWLSVQVHPDDVNVKTYWPGEGGKTEAWFVLRAEPQSKIYAGLLPGVDEKKLRASLLQGTITDCMYSYTPDEGDCLFLPAGTVHAVGGGVLMAEVQQTSDATFRLFDWNRKDAQGRSRELHIEQSFACIDWERGPIQPARSPWYHEMPLDRIEHHPLVECQYFRVEDVRGGAPFTVGNVNHLQMMIVTQGSGQLIVPDGVLPMSVGDTWMLPASMPEVQCVPSPTMGALLASPQPQA